jgi:hypothetical protein
VLGVKVEYLEASLDEMQKQYGSIESTSPRASASTPRASRRCGSVSWASDDGRDVTRILVALALAAGAHALSAQAQAPVAPQAQAAAPGPRSESGLGVLQGRWVRPDGGYTITIRQVDADGKLQAMYANPRPLPFSKAEATRDGKTIRLFFELTAGGYNGSTYTLTYDPAGDVLQGVYYQAVARQKFDVQFMRVK